MKISSSKPIGVFDSGIGGLTVVREIINILPNEDIIYFGDIARIPYGTKSVATIRKFASETVRFLLKQDVKAIVIACNTISAVAKDTVTELAKNIPVIDVISSGSEASINNKNGLLNHKIGVIATPATINSSAYTKSINKINPKAIVINQPCPLFVPLIEEGLLNHPALELIAKDYLTPLNQQRLDCLILGCTHYPLIKAIIQKFIGNSVLLIDPAISTSLKLLQILQFNNLVNPKVEYGNYSFFVTEVSHAFRDVGETFLQRPIDNLQLVSVE